jgi:hypothetical protein
MSCVAAYCCRSEAVAERIAALQRAVASHFKGGTRRSFSSGDKRDKERDRGSACFFKSNTLFGLQFKNRRKPRLFLPESRAYFSRPTESGAYFSRLPGCEKSPSRRKPRLFLPPPRAREIALGQSRAYFSRLVCSHEAKARLFLPAGVLPQGEGALISPAPSRYETSPFWRKPPFISPGSWNPITGPRQRLHATLASRAACSRASVRYRG